MNSRIAIVTTKQPGTNPRMRKNADALTAAGYDVHVLYAYSTLWADESDAELFQKATWNHTRIGGHPHHSKWRHFRHRMIRKCARWFGWTDFEFCPAQRSYLQTLDQVNPQLVIGHNPGALPILSKWTSITGTPVLFDAEDFHSGEYQEGSPEQKKMSSFEGRHLRMLHRITAASPLIGKAYLERFPHLDVIPINNAFDAALQPDFQALNEGPLKLVWFSQVIGLDRGIQDVLSHLQNIPNLSLEITLIGSCDNVTRKALESHINSEVHSLRWHGPCSEPELMKLVSQHHVGLAIEADPNANRSICRTNKLYTYPICGCWTLASQTTGQIQFYEEYPELGETLELRNGASWAKRLMELAASLETLSKQRRRTWTLSKDHLNWETESQKLLAIVDKMLDP